MCFTGNNAARTDYLSNFINLVRFISGMSQSIDLKPSVEVGVDELKCVLMVFKFREMSELANER